MTNLEDSSNKGLRICLAYDLVSLVESNSITKVSYSLLSFGKILAVAIPSLHSKNFDLTVVVISCCYCEPPNETSTNSSLSIFLLLGYAK